MLMILVINTFHIHSVERNKKSGEMGKKMYFVMDNTVINMGEIIACEKIIFWQ